MRFRHPLLAAMLIASMAQAQAQAPARRGAISGTVIDGATGAALADVIVSVSPQAGTQMPAGYQTRQLTDAKGRFAFLNLPDDGTFQIGAGKYGYLDGGYGRDSGPTDPLRTVIVANGSWAGNLRVRIWRPAVIAGTVRDETGEPIVGVFVRALARIRVAGRDDLAAGPSTVTDDYGRYRIPGLLPGRYAIQVPSVQSTVPAGTRLGTAPSNMPEGAIDVDDTTRLVVGRYPLPPPGANGRAMTYGIAFHPGATNARDAGTIEVAYGDDRSGVDVALTPVPAVRISGTVEGPPEALSNLTLRLLPAGMENAGLGADVATALVGANGSFSFVNVPPGVYTLDAPLVFNEYTMQSGSTSGGGSVRFAGGPSIGAPPGTSGWSRSSQDAASIPGVSFTTTDYRGTSGRKVPNYTARMPLMVPAADVNGLVVRLQPGAMIRGRIVLELDPAKPSPKPAPGFSVMMDPASGQPSLGAPSQYVPAGPTQEFELTGLQPAEYFLRVGGDVGWVVKSIQWRDRDYTTAPLDAATTDDLSGVVVTMTNLTTTLGGAVRDQNGAVPDNAVVIIFPVQPALRTNAGLWSPRLASVPLQNTGTFRITRLPAGDYFVAAIEGSRRATWRDPDFLAFVERSAARVTLAWGQPVTRDLTMTVIR